MAGWDKKDITPVDPAARRAELTARVKQYFKPAVELEIKDSVKLGIFGGYKTGKTHFCITCKKPLMVIDTEDAWNWEIEMARASGMDVSEIDVTQVLHWANKEEGKVDLVQSLEAMIDAIDVLTSLIALDKGNPDARRGTIVIDSMSDLWGWLGSWKEELDAGKEKTNRLDWGKVNKRYIEVIYMLLHSNWNVVLTFRSKPQVDEKGSDTGIRDAQWQKNTGYYIDSVIEFDFVAQEFQATFHKGRLGKFMYGKVMRNPDWPTLIKYIKDNAGITIY